MGKNIYINNSPSLIDVWYISKASAAAFDIVKVLFFFWLFFSTFLYFLNGCRVAWIADTFGMIKEEEKRDSVSAPKHFIIQSWTNELYTPPSLKKEKKGRLHQNNTPLYTKILRLVDYGSLSRTASEVTCVYFSFFYSRRKKVLWWGHKNRDILWMTISCCSCDLYILDWRLLMMIGARTLCQILWNNKLCYIEYLTAHIISTISWTENLFPNYFNNLRYLYDIYKKSLNVNTYIVFLYWITIYQSSSFVWMSINLGCI